MSVTRELPFNAWRWGQATAETVAAGLDPQTIGRWWREHRLQSVMRTGALESPLYRRRLEARGIPVVERARSGRLKLDDFEPITKRQLMQSFDDWATDRRITRAVVDPLVRDPSRLGEGLLGEYLVWTSSGTSGEPGIFVQDASSLAAYDAIEGVRLRGHQRFGGHFPAWPMSQRYAFIGAMGGHFAGNASFARVQQVLRGKGGTVDFLVLSVLDPVEDIVQALNEFRPTVIITYPTCADLLAGLQESGALSVKVAEVWMGGEQLTPAQRDRITRAFGCQIANNYGASECYVIACECTQGVMHLNSDWVVVEPVDGDNRPVPEGEPGEKLLLTNLANRVQPIIRYVLEDRIRVLPSMRCRCGSRFPAIEVSGRSDDTLTLEDEEGRPVSILALGLMTAIEEDAGVTRFQVLQAGPASLEMRFEEGEPDHARAFERTVRAVQDFLARHRLMHIDIRHGQEPPKCEGISGKMRRVRRL